MVKSRETLRHTIDADQDYSLGVITFRQLRWVDHKVHLVDMSKSGVGVSSEKPIDPGFIWFNDRVRGHKGGVLVWCRKLQEQYRAGIRFVPLTEDEERLVQEGIVRSGHRPLRMPEEIISALMGAVTRSNG